MNAISLDTTIEAAKKQYDILRKLGPEARLIMTFELSDNLRSVVEAGVKLRHPDYDEQRIEQRVLRLMIGETLFKKMNPDIGI